MSLHEKQKHDVQKARCMMNYTKGNTSQGELEIAFEEIGKGKIFKKTFFNDLDFFYLNEHTLE